MRSLDGVLLLAPVEAPTLLSRDASGSLPPSVASILCGEGLQLPGGTSRGKEDGLDLRSQSLNTGGSG